MGWQLKTRQGILDLTSRSLVMGILNRTPDSFFDKGRYYDLDTLLERADRLVQEGADILDVGGVKAGPGPEVSLEEELDRVVPAIGALSDRFGVLLSVDTWSSKVLAEAIGAGASIGNDISGFSDPEYLRVAAGGQAAVVATHIRLAPRVRDPEPAYDDLVFEVEEFLLERSRWAQAAGIEPESVIFDAGYDLGKTTEQSLALLGATQRLASHDHVLLVSASNKGFLGEALSLEVDQRREASISAAAFAACLGGRIFRVHDVRGTRRALDTISAISDMTSSGIEA